MYKTVVALGWPVAIALAIALAYQLAGRGESSLDGVEKSDVTEEIADSATGREKRVAELEREVASLSGELSDAHSEAASLEEELLEQHDADLLDAASQFKEHLDALATSDSSGDEAPDDKSPTTLASGESGSEVAGNMVTLGARMTVNSQYGPFIDFLDLDAETAELVREIMITAVAEQGKMGMRMMSGQAGSDAEEPIDYDAWMRDELSTVLAAEELQYFDEFQAEAGGLAGHQIDSQLGLFATDLTPENRELARQVLVEEMFAPPQQGANEEAIDAASVGGQLELYRRAADRLATVFDADQIEVFDQFVNRQSSFIEMAVGMMGSEE